MVPFEGARPDARLDARPETSLRTASLVAGGALAIMAVVAPLGLSVALPAGLVGMAALAVLLVATLDVVAGVALYPVLRPGGPLLAACASGLRVAYGAGFAAAAGSLVAGGTAFTTTWQAVLFLFGAHLVLAGVAAIRAAGVPTWIGVVVVVAGLGYAIDAAGAVLAGHPLGLVRVAFAGEVVLLVWLLGWSGRTRRPA